MDGDGFSVSVAWGGIDVCCCCCYFVVLRSLVFGRWFRSGGNGRDPSLYGIAMAVMITLH